MNDCFERFFLCMRADVRVLETDKSEKAIVRTDNYFKWLAVLRAFALARNEQRSRGSIIVVASCFVN